MWNIAYVDGILDISIHYFKMTAILWTCWIKHVDNSIRVVFNYPQLMLNRSEPYLFTKITEKEILVHLTSVFLYQWLLILLCFYYPNLIVLNVLPYNTKKYEINHIVIYPDMVEIKYQNKEFILILFNLFEIYKLCICNCWNVCLN